MFNQLTTKKTSFYFRIKPNEPISHEVKCNLFNFLKKRMYDFYHFFEKTKKKVYNKKYNSFF